MYNPLTPYVVKSHHETIQKDFDRSRATEGEWRPGFGDQFFVRLGDFLISAGEKLHDRYDPLVCSDCGVYPSSAARRLR